MLTLLNKNNGLSMFHLIVISFYVSFETTVINFDDIQKKGNLLKAFNWPGVILFQIVSCLSKNSEMNASDLCNCVFMFNCNAFTIMTQCFSCFDWSFAMCNLVQLTNKNGYI